MASPFDAITPGDEQDALHSITQMLVGTKALQSQPGVVYALAAQQARPQDAQAIDQFLQGLDAEKKFRIAQATGQKITFTPDEKTQLKTLGIDYTPVEYTQQDAAKVAAMRITSESAGTMRAVQDENGNYVINKDGSIKTEAVPQPKQDTGYGTGFLGLGPLWHTLHNDVIKPLSRDVIDPATSVLSKPLNLLNTGMQFENAASALNTDAVAKLAASQVQDMQAKGYDPSSVWSTLAYQSSGKAASDRTDLINKWDELHPQGLYGLDGTQAVTEAEAYLNNPDAYRKAIENNPAYFTKQGSQTVMTKEGQAALQRLQSPEFTRLVTEVNARMATPGNDLANLIGIDPVNHPTYYALTAAGTNIATSFAIDPLMALGAATRATKLAQIGINSLGDATGAAKILDRVNSTGFYARRVQRGWQRGIDLADGIRKAQAAGDTTEVASLTARFNAELPGLAPMMDDFIGTHMLRDPKDWETVIKDGKPIVTPTYEVGDGIRNLDEAAAYVESRYGLTRLVNGRAATQASLMPGSLSSFGYRTLKGSTAGWMTSRSSERALAAQQEVLSAASHDPALAQKMISEGDLVRLMPSADNAVSAITGQVLADKTLENLSHNTNVTIEALNKQLSDIEAFGKGDAEQAATIRSNLDELESQLQELMADKKAYHSADPNQLAALHDQISESRSLLEMAEQNAIGSKAAAEKISQKGNDLLDSMNPPMKGEQQFGNMPIHKDGSIPATGDQYALTYAGKGKIANNLRRTGSALGGHAVGWSSPTALAARARLAAQRWSTMLPRNTMFQLDDAATADKIYKYALSYLNRGDANALRAAFLMGDGGQRAAVVEGLFEQVAHAAGLGMSETGRNLIKASHTVLEGQHYSSVGDEIIRDGVPLALHAGQIRQTWVLPDFRALQRASAKIGLWEATMGRAMTSAQADFLMSQWKMGALFKPSTITRNQLEGWGRTALEGKFGDAIKARAVLTMPNKELWKLGYAKEARADYERLMADGDTKAAKEIANGSMLSGKFLGRSVISTKIAEFAPLALAGRAYRLLMGKHMDAETVEAMMTLGKDELAQALHEYGQQIREADLGTRRMARESTEIAQAGWGPSRIKFALERNRRKGDKVQKSATWTQQDTDGTTGADRFEGALAMRINATPSVARAAIAHLEAEANGEAPDIQALIDAMDHPDIANQMSRTSWGKVTWDNNEGIGPARAATNDVETALGKRIFATKVLNDYRYLFTGQNQKLQKELMREVRITGRAPSAAWIEKHLKGDNRPEAVYAPETMALAQGGVRGVLASLQDIEGAGYEWMVERPLLRTTSSPVFLANYAEARRGLNPMVDQLVEQGFGREAAENMARELAIKNAWTKTEQLIDDPGQKTQFDIVARNMFPFSRATQAMIRRWGSGLWQDPARARKMMLAYEGGVQSGFIYNNVYGEPTFTYPASGALNMVMRELAKVPGFENLNQFPISSSMTGGVLMAVPGADNPFRMSMGPMLSIPMREIFDLFPDHKAMLDEVDAAINGPIGVGETWIQAAPAVGRKFYTAMNGDERNSALASAMTGAIANLAAAGLLPNADASPADREAFLARLKAQVRTQLYLRAVFGLFAPAAPSAPSEGTGASQADYLFHMGGIGQLADEYRTILNDVSGDTARANAIWTAMHPDELVYTKKGAISGKSKVYSGYEVARTQSMTSNAYLPATNAALNWMESNSDFIKKYNNVAAYFIPKAAATGEFNDQAYQTQLELALRQKKTPEEFYRDVRVRDAEAIYYPAVQGFDDRINAAKQSGDTTLASQWTKAKSLWERKFKAHNPYFQEKIDSYPDARATALDQLSNLEEMVRKGQVPDGQAKLLNELIMNYNNYANFIGKHGGGTDAETAIRSAALGMFNDWVSKNIAGSGLEDLYSGVFRTLNTNFVNLNSTQTGG